MTSSVAPYLRVPRLTPLVAGTTPALGGTHPNPRGYFYMQRPPEASPATHRGAPGQHLAGTLPRRAWHQIRTYPGTWLEPYLDVHLSYPCLAASLNPSYSWLEPDLDVAGT